MCAPLSAFSSRFLVFQGASAAGSGAKPVCARQGHFFSTPRHTAADAAFEQSQCVGSAASLAATLARHATEVVGGCTSTDAREHLKQSRAAFGQLYAFRLRGSSGHRPASTRARPLSNAAAPELGPHVRGIWMRGIVVVRLLGGGIQASLCARSKRAMPSKGI